MHQIMRHIDLEFLKYADLLSHSSVKMNFDYRNEQILRVTLTC